MMYSVELQQDCNDRKYYELVVTTNEEYKSIPCELIYTDKDGHKFWYGEDANGLVNFYSNGVASLGHDANYQWSSRAGVFNALGKKCMEIVLIPKEGWKIATSMTVEKVKELLPIGYKVVVRKEWYDDDDEIVYAIIKE